MDVKKGDKVSVKYTGRLDSQVVFDSTDNREPLVFTVGNGDLIEKFEDSVIGMKTGETKTIKIGCTDAYGEYSNEFVFEVPIAEFPKEIPMEAGTPLQLQQENGQVAVVKIKEVKDDKVVIDANHPLAGQDLTFDITLVDILVEDGL
jgi:peptidylprolyl isomerase